MYAVEALRALARTKLRIFFGASSLRAYMCPPARLSAQATDTFAELAQSRKLAGRLNIGERHHICSNYCLICVGPPTRIRLPSRVIPSQTNQIDGMGLHPS